MPARAQVRIEGDRVTMPRLLAEYAVELDRQVRLQTDLMATYRAQAITQEALIANLREQNRHYDDQLEQQRRQINLLESDLHRSVETVEDLNRARRRDRRKRRGWRTVALLTTGSSAILGVLVWTR